MARVCTLPWPPKIGHHGAPLVGGQPAGSEPAPLPSLIRFIIRSSYHVWNMHQAGLCTPECRQLVPDIAHPQPPELIHQSSAGCVR
jgi:hypothetical protein